MKYYHDAHQALDQDEKRQLNEKRFFKKVQNVLNIFVFFLPIGFVKIGGVSITFFLFLYIMILFIRRKKKLFMFTRMTDLMLLVLFILFVLSIFFAEETFRELPFVKDAKLTLRLVYWLFLALFIKTWAHRLDFYQTSRSFFAGMTTLIVFYYTLNQSLEIVTQNSFAFMLVVTAPFSMYYIFKRFPFYITAMVAFSIFYFGLSSGSRAGALILFVQMVLLFLVAGYMRKKTLLFVLLLLLAPILLFTVGDRATYRHSIAELIRPYNPDTAELIENPDKVNEQDKSWLDRKQMLVKGAMIFEEHPWLGIGFGHFKYYWVNMPIISPYLNKSMFFYNRLSAHNTYIQVLAGSGIFALLLLLMIELRIMIRGVYVVKSFKNTPDIFIFISFAGMVIYFYVIAVAMGAITWFIMGYAMSLLHKRIRK